jgi:hypothetical protein
MRLTFKTETPELVLMKQSVHQYFLVEEVSKVIKKKDSVDSTVLDHSPLQLEDVMQLLEICIKTTYLQSEDFYQQKEGIAMGSLLSPVVSYIFMDHFEELAVDIVDQKLVIWLR